jgi:hypothetical protein
MCKVEALTGYTRRWRSDRRPWGPSQPKRIGQRRRTRNANSGMGKARDLELDDGMRPHNLDHQVKDLFQI